jgi:uncharacterized repeat protein (TIGR03803 family)
MSTFNWWMRASTLFLLWAATAVALPAQTFKTLRSFDDTDGWSLRAGLVQGVNGNLYGTTYYGGADNYGTVFEISPSGTLTTLRTFDSTDGGYPSAGLVQATNGNLYGTTYGGGAHAHGTVFEITPSGTPTTLHSFAGYPSDGALPYAELVQGTNGNFYGTTESGGAHNYGTVFEITPAGKLMMLYSFCSKTNCTDGYAPYASLVQGTDGDFYGTTLYGGTDGYGTVFEISLSGTLKTLYSFHRTDDGASPYAGLVQATSGDFYGTTELGGTGSACTGGCGTVFKISPSGTLTTLYSFDHGEGAVIDGAFPYAGLVQGTDGDLYGTTPNGGVKGLSEYCEHQGCGTVFKITPGGTLTTLYRFCLEGDCPDGSSPLAALIQDTDGSFYGTTETGGTSSACAGGCGTVFSLSVGLGPFVETLPASGAVGAAVKILGTDLTGATKVTFNGKAATFKVASSSEITATVPADATTGTVKVIDPSSTLSSNVPFRVTP